jgi:hypothetical protein
MIDGLERERYRDVSGKEMHTEFLWGKYEGQSPLDTPDRRIILKWVSIRCGQRV